MGAAKEVIDLVVDFIIFIAACAFTIGGFANTASVQNTLNNTLTDKGSSMIADAFPETHSTGEEMIAILLLPEGISKVSVDGNVFTGNVMEAINYIVPNGIYEVEREYATDGLRLLITKIEG